MGCFCSGKLEVRLTDLPAGDGARAWEESPILKIQWSDKTADMNDAEYLETGKDRRQPLPELTMAKMLRAGIGIWPHDCILRRPISASLRFMDEAVIGGKGVRE
jgi:hypothetical protein